MNLLNPSSLPAKEDHTGLESNFSATALNVNPYHMSHAATLFGLSLLHCGH